MERDPVPGRSAALGGLGLSSAGQTPISIALNVIDNRPDFIYWPVFFSGQRN